MDVKIAGNALVITSSVDLGQLKRVTKYNPKALRLYDEEKNEVFAVFTEGKAAITSVGITLSEATADGKAQATLALPDKISADKRTAYVEENYGVALFNLMRVECNVAAAAEAIEARLNEVAAAIREV